MSCNRVFIIADTHFGHSKIIEFEPARMHYKSIEEHDLDLIARWNAVVKENDTVWHLGDVWFGELGYLALSCCNGIKKLVMGNHDKYPAGTYLNHFNQLYGAVKYRDCILTHVPVTDKQKYRFKRNLHGHMHSKVMEDPWYINVSAEQQNLAPKLLDTVLQGVT